MPQLFHVVHLSCAPGYLPSLFMVLHISTYSLWSLGVLFSIIRFLIRALVGDDILGFFCFLVCFALLVPLCWNISVMFLFRVSMSSSSYSAANLFSSLFQSFGCQLLFVNFCLGALPFRSLNFNKLCNISH